MTTIQLPLRSGYVLLRRPRLPQLRPILSALARVVAWPARVIAARRVVGALSGMSDRELSDIGLARQDLRDASALPLDADPSRLFADRARTRLRRP
jgi:uncharacterized protein YjiS (DUF1127 family)